VLPDPVAQEPAVRRVIEAAARRGVALAAIRLDDSTHTAVDAARALGVELGQIVKSLVFVAPRPDRAPEPVICLAAGTNRVDLALLAAATGEPGLRRATAREARDLTGFAIGGIPPLGHASPARVVMDPDLERYETVWAAAGQDRAVFPISPAELRGITDAVVAPVADRASS
jgi:prolyl-tRNA editing enzyme YbaK/EbsC (Cys-tRNA(Pro) deacylase)